MLYQKRKPLSCVCGSQHTEALNPYEDIVCLYCIDCGTRNYLTKNKYCDEFELWLDLKISKFSAINKLFNTKN
jgi:hypothetical protein